MGSCASCVSFLGVTFLGIATMLCIICLFTPFWLTTNLPNVLSLLGSPEQISKGLYLECSDPYTSNRGCSWIKFDAQDEWFQVVMVLWAIGTAVLLLIEIASFVICCESCRTPRYAAFVTFGTLVSAICLATAVIVYGVKLEDKFDREARTYYDWGYYLAIGGSGCAVVGFIFFASSIYCLRSN